MLTEIRHVPYGWGTVLGAIGPVGSAEKELARMHELSIAEAIAHKVRERAAGRSVAAVAIQVGHFRQIVPDALEFCWTMVTDATGLEGCRLQIEQIPATVRCEDCEFVSMLDVPILMCESCGGTNVTLLTGQEFMVVSLEILEV
jgi:hydrogenase nickel incorporation protein HypA/HybF